MKEQWKGDALRLRCPFTGRPIKVCSVGPNWVAVSEGSGGGWTTGMFADRAELISFLVESLPAVEAQEPAKKPITRCPMTGLGFKITESQGRGWVASVADDRGRGYSTTPFWSRRHLEYFLSTRAGVPPLFDASAVEVRERRPPPPPDPEKQAVSEQRGVVREKVEEVVHNLRVGVGVRQPRVFVGANQRG